MHYYRDWKFEGLTFRSYFHELTNSEIPEANGVIYGLYSMGKPHWIKFDKNCLIVDNNEIHIHKAFQKWLEYFNKDWRKKRNSNLIKDAVPIK